jgi:hypothetical protein
MHEATAKNRVVERILGQTDESQKASSKERQHTAQAFTLHVEWRDGRKTEGFAWAHYLGYRWTDDSEKERLVLIFGERALEIEGHNLEKLVEDIRDGKLNGIREMNSARQTQLRNENPDREPVISAIHSFPDVEEIFREIKGERDGKAGYAGRIR